MSTDTVFVMMPVSYLASKGVLARLILEPPLLTGPELLQTGFSLRTSKPFWEIPGCSTSLMGNRELHEATSVLAAWIFLQLFLLCIWNWCITLAAILSSTQMPQSLLGVLLALLPRNGWGLGWEWAGHRAPSQCCSLSFHPRNYSCSSGAGILASYITFRSPTSNVYAWTSCPGLGFTTQNSDLTCQRHFFSFAPPPHPTPGSGTASHWMGRGRSSLRKHGEKMLISILKCYLAPCTFHIFFTIHKQKSCREKSCKNCFAVKAILFWISTFPLFSDGKAATDLLNTFCLVFTIESAFASIYVC